ncbi:response regulator [Treponema zuelzerae]|uniref:Response regulator n=1 Tax=Teretinema zuelzerae TaxID=156 RepID=A0AAE3EGL0_9SPIR|nr:response regulator [Teretinema zuelzerae]MBN2810652.1 response regulator [Spirochaetales bacterium]MCD1653820.1 response regulator [Teretinema zuelzerae]
MKTIMLVDDSTSIRNILKNALIGQYAVVEAEHGKDALSKLGAQTVDLFLFDVNMPEMDGIELLAEVRKKPSYAKTPILMLTTETKEELRQKGRELGASGWIVKPCEPDKLLSAIQKLIP